MQLTLQDLISSVEATSNSPLAQLAEASTTGNRLAELSDALTTHFVERCRSAGASWAEVGESLGVTRQAVQKRFSEGVGSSVHPAPERRYQEHQGKYRPLWRWLTDQERNTLSVTFADIERQLGFRLPPSSRKHQAHWHSYDGSAVVRAIVDAGWRAQRVDLAKETVVLARSSRSNR